ncbi:MAG: hypothetical protein O9301_09045 [Leptospira sp.]|nr:hypothetical protein [Leptospira sp.]
MRSVLIFLLIFLNTVSCKSTENTCEVKSCLNGWQVIEYPNGDQYEGHFYNDLKEGIGIYRYANGDRYEGFYRNDLRHGEGIYFYQNGDRFEGKYQNGKRNGSGKYTFSDGSFFVGDWKDNQFSGYTRLLNPKQSLVLEGYWSGSQFQKEQSIFRSDQLQTKEKVSE